MYYFAHEKFIDAVHSLTTGAGDVRSRLRLAYGHFHPVREKNLPDELKDDYSWVMNQLLKFGSVSKTLSRIRNSTGIKIAERIWHIYTQLNWLYITKELKTIQK